MPLHIGSVSLIFMTSKHPTVERILRKSLPGNTNAKARAVVRSIVEGNDYAGHVAELRALSTNPHAIIPSDVCSAVADELERIAKDKARTLATNAEIAKAQTDGCPCCGAKIKRNLSLSGWWQCAQFGAVGFRADGTKPACSWQAFYVEVAS